MVGKNFKDLVNRILFTLAMLFICRIGAFIPVPGIDGTVLEEIYSNSEGNILGMLNMLSGGSLGRMSIFSLAIMPYITASIIVQLASSIYKPLSDLKKEGGDSRKKISQISRYLTVVFAAFQAYGLTVGTELFAQSYGRSIIIIPSSLFRISSVLTLVVGTVVLMWIGEQISNRGIGNGTSMIIFIGIIVGLPKGIFSIFELSRKGAISPVVLILIFLGVFVIISVIIFFEKAQRRVLIVYPKRQVGNKLYGGDSSYMPLKLNTSGVIPPIFANSLLLVFPTTIAAFYSSESGSKFLSFFTTYLSQGKILYVILYALLIIFFCFFYSSIVFNSDDVAANLKKQDAYIPGIRPGKNTSEYFSSLLNKINVIGSVYLSFVCILPEILFKKYSVSFALGGTSFLIVVNVVLDTFIQIQTNLFSSKYESLIKKMKLKK